MVAIRSPFFVNRPTFTAFSAIRPLKGARMIVSSTAFRPMADPDLLGQQGLIELSHLVDRGLVLGLGGQIIGAAEVMLGTRDRPFLEELGKALVVRLGTLHSRPGLLYLWRLEGVKGLPIHQAESFSDLGFGGLGLAEQVLGVLIVHARHYLPGGDVLPALDRDLHDPLLDLGGNIGLCVGHQRARDVQGRR